MLLNRNLGVTSLKLRVKLLNSSVTTGAGLTGLVFNSSGLIISTIVDNEASATVYTTAGSTIETITTLGTYAAPTATKCRFKEVDATNHPGVYELQFADARLAVSSATQLLVSISGATNLAQCDFVIDLKSGVDVRSWIGTTVPTALETKETIRAEIDSNSTQLAKLGTPAGASVSADVAAAQAVLNSVTARLPTALNNGYISASEDAYQGVAATGDGSVGNNIRPTGIAVS